MLNVLSKRCFRRCASAFSVFRVIAVAVLVLFTMAVGAKASNWVTSYTSNGSQFIVSYGSGSSYPEYAVFDLASSYYRMVAGPTVSWGTSMILQPAYWSGGVLYQGGPIRLKSQSTDTSSDLVLNFSGTIGKLSTSSIVTIQPPANNSLTAQVKVWVTGNVKLDTNRPGEAFKPVQFSSMNDSSTVWDSQYVVTGDGVIYYYPPSSSWVLQQVSSQHVSLPGGTSQWKTNAVSMDVSLDNTYPISGWHTADTNPNDDNILVWNSSSSVLPYWGYSVMAH